MKFPLDNSKIVFYFVQFLNRLYKCNYIKQIQQISKLTNTIVGKIKIAYHHNSTFGLHHVNLIVKKKHGNKQNITLIKH